MKARTDHERGAALVEAALISGLLVFIALGAIEWGFGLKDWLSVTSGTREGARVGAAAGDETDADCRILEATAKRLGLADQQVYINVDRCGNTSGASIPIALDEANRAGMLQEGDLVLFDAFGGGFTWASALVRW